VVMNMPPHYFETNLNFILSIDVSMYLFFLNRLLKLHKTIITYKINNSNYLMSSNVHSVFKFS
jgi:hypothetical protein